MTSRSVDDFARRLAPPLRRAARTSSMDQLARNLASPMPRRRALHLLGSALVVAAVPALRPSWAGARTAGGGIEDRPDIIDPPEGPFGPPVRCGEFRGKPLICNPTSNCVKCCPAEGGGGSCCPCYFSCRPRSGLCDKQIACPPDGRPFCGPPGKCCLPNESCWRGSVCLPVCKPNEQLCNDDCCPPGTECVNLQFPGSGRGRLTCMPKCPRGRTRCGINCCPPRQKCIDARVGRCSPCDIGERPCGRKCCQRGSTCCDPNVGLCCKSNETCAGYGRTAKCCPKGTRACEAGGRLTCCKKGERCAQVADGSGTVPFANRRKYTCCPPARTVEFSGGAVAACCPDGYRSLGGRFILPPGGGGGLCCREDKVCGSTCCGTNNDPGINQTCCNGRCVSLFFDPQNCGSCGRRCPPGNRCQSGNCVPA